MYCETIDENDFLLIRLSGAASPNERLVVKQSLMPYLHRLNPRVIVDLSGLVDQGGTYVVGILNMIRKEVQILGGKMRLCALEPRLYRYFLENRLLDIFETTATVQQATESFRKDAHAHEG